MKILKRIIISLLIFLSVFFVFNKNVKSQICNKDDCEKLIKETEQKLSVIRNQKNSLSAEIQYMDSQIYLTTLKIQSTQQQISDTEAEIETLGGRIEGVNSSLDYLTKLLFNKIKEGYKRREIPFFNILLDADNASTLFNQLKYARSAQENDRRVAFQLQQAKQNFEDQKDLRERKKIELDNLQATQATQKVNLNIQKADKQRLLAETQNSEAVYQSLLNQARTQLAGFTSFVSSQGGSSILSNQTVCDDWGCYYNQRDSQWGSNSLNGTGFTLANAGCLVTSMAMIYTHYGFRNVTPQTINSNSQNFASYYPAYLNFTIVADGKSSTRINSAIDSELSAGNPVIVGIGNGPDHFLVLISGSNGNYQMNDPYTANGHNISFSSVYSTNSITTVQKVSF